MDRRSFIAALSLASIGCGAAQAQASQRGCCIFPQTGYVFGVSNPNSPPARSQDVDDLLARLSRDSQKGQSFEEALGSILSEMSRVFRVTPGFGFFNDALSPNAVAVDRAWVRETEGTIGFGRRLLDQQLFLNPTGESVAAVCAHEFGHIFQYKSGYYDQIVRANLPDYAIELHADYLAGYFLNHLFSTRPAFDLIEVGEAWEGMGSADFNRLGSHGSTDQRLAAIERGYQDRRQGRRTLDASSAGAAGLRYLRQVLP